jgi:cyclopropane fatty-acyl-phospholipid synthase-like methyltransferase
MNENTLSALSERFFRPEFPRSSRYDPHWLMDNAMGPHVLWLAEWLSQQLELSPGMRVLDLGCGKAISSIFLAKEFGVTVWAADLWIKPKENFERIDQAGCSGSVFPVSVEAHSLPFPEGSFDAIVSFDAYHYFGTDDLYLGYLSSFLRPGGRLGIVVPGTLSELAELPPPHLAHYWAWDFCSFHSPGWWRRHWEKTGLLEVERADTLENGWKLWLEWNELCVRYGRQKLATLAHREAEMLRVDNGRTFGFTRAIAKRTR